MQKTEFIKIQSFKNGTEAIEFPYKDYYSYIYQFIISNGGTPEEAYNVFIETLNKFHATFNEYIYDSNILKTIIIRSAQKSWLNRILK